MLLFRNQISPLLLGLTPEYIDGIYSYYTVVFNNPSSKAKSHKEHIQICYCRKTLSGRICSQNDL